MVRRAVEIEEPPTGIVVDEAYRLAIGQAVVAFAAVEWCIVCITAGLTGEGIRPPDPNRTAGAIAKALQKAIRCPARPLLPTERGNLEEVHRRFVDLARRERNELLHSHPFSDNGPTRLRGRDVVWRTERVWEAAAKFEDFLRDLQPYADRHRP